MRVGRSLTITDIDTYITNYISNYELTEEQINQMLANASGALGCLSYLLGIDSNLQPVTYLLQSSQSCSTAPASNYLSFDSADIDNLDAWDIANPTYINLRYTGLYVVTFECAWATNSVGYRLAYFNAGSSPPIRDYRQAQASGGVSNGFSRLVYIPAKADCQIDVKQSSGGNLNCTNGRLLIRRVGFGNLGLT